LEKTKEQLQIDLKTKNSELQKNEKAIEEVKALQIQKKKEIDNKQNKIRENKRDIDKKVKEMAKKKGEVQKFECQKQRLESKLESVEQQLNNVRDKINENTAKISNLETHKTQLKNALEQNIKARDKLEQEGVKVEGEKKQLEQERANFEREIKREYDRLREKENVWKTKHQEIANAVKDRNEKNNQLSEFSIKRIEKENRATEKKHQKKYYEEQIDEKVSTIMEKLSEQKNLKNSFPAYQKKNQDKEIEVSEELKIQGQEYYKFNLNQ